ncbi:MAG: hypothetical protein CL696_03350 [Chloroflexi bacterium]|nr:hypothetical protein [Chloroflexota bacterium]MDP6497605.1 hypothetical protein [Dehalococcoidia bacterium]
MDWIAVGAIAELVGVVAVVITLIYLADQVRNNTRMAQRASTVEAVAAIRTFSVSLVDNRKVGELFQRGVNLGLENLTDEERVPFAIMMFNLLKTCEHLHYQHAVGAMDPDVLKGWDHIIRGYLTAPGSQEWYQERRIAFSLNFRNYLDNSAPDEGFKLLGQIG